MAEVEALGHHGHVGEAGVAHVRHQRVRDVGRGVQDLRTRLPVPPAVPVLVAGTPVAIPVPSGTPVSIPIPVPVSVPEQGQKARQERLQGQGQEGQERLQGQQVGS